MKKIICLLLVAMMSISLCACGGNDTTSGDNKEEGFTPSQVTEKDEKDEKDTVTPEEIDVNNLQKYYDVTKCVGAPRLEIYSTSFFIAEQNPETITLVHNNGHAFEIAFTNELKPNVDYYVIVCDNDTPNKLNDDVLAYVFTTPIEE